MMMDLVTEKKFLQFARKKCSHLYKVKSSLKECGFSHVCPNNGIENGSLYDVFYEVTYLNYQP